MGAGATIHGQITLKRPSFLKPLEKIFKVDLKGMSLSGWFGLKKVAGKRPWSFAGGIIGMIRMHVQKECDICKSGKLTLVKLEATNPRIVVWKMKNKLQNKFITGGAISCPVAKFNFSYKTAPIEMIPGGFQFSAKVPMHGMKVPIVISYGDKFSGVNLMKSKTPAQLKTNPAAVFKKVEKPKPPTWNEACKVASKNHRVKGQCRAWKRFCKIYKEFEMPVEAEKKCVLMRKAHACLKNKAQCEEYHKAVKKSRGGEEAAAAELLQQRMK